MTAQVPGEVTVQYWAAARAARRLLWRAVPGGHRRQALSIVAERHGDRLRAVLARCSFLVDGAPVGRRDPASVQVSPGSVIEVLPPFAGG